jgi:hypothetical protein
MPDSSETPEKPRPSDRLLELSACRDALALVQLKTPQAVLRAAPQTVQRLRPHEEVILRLVEAGDPEVMRALFSSAVNWHVAYKTPGALDRTLTIRYEATIENERRLWRALKAAFGRDEPPPAP